MKIKEIAMKSLYRFASVLFAFVLTISLAAPAFASDSILNPIGSTNEADGVSMVASSEYPNVYNSIPCNITDASWKIEFVNIFESYIELTIPIGNIKVTQDAEGRAVGAVTDSPVLYDLAKLVKKPVEEWIVYGHDNNPDEIPVDHWRITVPKTIVILNFFTNLFMDPFAKFKYILSPSKLLYLRCEPPAKAAPPPQYEITATQEIFPGGSFQQETGVCFDETYDIEYRDGDIWLAGDDTGQADWALDDALSLSISHPDGSIVDLNLFSNTHDIAPVNLRDSFMPGINHVRVQVNSTIPPLCGGGHLWLKWDGGMSLPSEEMYSIIEQLSIVEPAPSAQLRYPIYVPGWMRWIQTRLHKGSNAIITLIAPDGTVYSSLNPSVSYTDDLGFAIHTLNLDSPQEGIWEVVIDVISAESDSVFLLDVFGKQGDVLSTDDIAPVTSMHFDGTKGLNGWFVSDVVITLAAEDNPDGSGVQGIELSLDNGVTWNAYVAPFVVSQEGLSYVLGRSFDNTGNYEESPIGKFLPIDKTPPIVDVYVDQLEYTRVEPFTVHYSGYDPLPGSGLASLTAFFNNQVVTDGQVVDLFWLPLGTYTLTAIGEDYAGRTTSDIESIKLIATIPSLQVTVDRLCADKYITKQGVCKSLSQKLKSALSAQKREQNKTAINILRSFQYELKAQKGKAVEIQAYNLLIMDSNYVIKIIGGK